MEVVHVAVHPAPRVESALPARKGRVHHAVHDVKVQVRPQPREDEQRRRPQRVRQQTPVMRDAAAGVEVRHPNLKQRADREPRRRPEPV